MNTIDERLLTFISEARRRGYSDSKIKQALIEKSWPADEVEQAFHLAKLSESEQNSKKEGGKFKIEVYLETEVFKNVEKRARKNMLSVPEQIEDIVRRSCVRSKLIKPFQSEKIDDLLISVFSRRKSGRK